MMRPSRLAIRCSQLAPAVATIPAICAVVQITRRVRAELRAKQLGVGAYGAPNSAVQ